MPGDRRGRLRLLAAAVALALLVGACSDGDPAPSGQASPLAERQAVAALDDAGTSEAAAGANTSALPYTSMVATPVAAGRLAVHDAPDGEVLHELDHPKLVNGDPAAAVPLVLLVKGRQRDWYEVYLPLRPNGSSGWIRSADVQVDVHDYRIEVMLAEYRLRVFRGDRQVFEAPIGVAKDNTPTPGGLYFTTELIRPADAPTGPYGSYAYGLSGYSEVLHTFNGGPGQLGIHGTNDPGSIGTAASSGCIRLRNEDIEHLAETLGLPLGVPVLVLTGDDAGTRRDELAVTRP